MRNVCLSLLKESRKQLLFDEVPRRAEAGLSDPSAEEAIDRLALREWVWTALSALPEVLRVTAMLRYFGSYATYEEISAILGVPVGTVRSRLNRVKVKLAEALLKTAGIEHDRARKLAESQIRHFTAAWDEINRGESHELFSSTFSEDLVWSCSDGTVRHGLAVTNHSLESELQALGIKHHPTTLSIALRPTRWSFSTVPAGYTGHSSISHRARRRKRFSEYPRHRSEGHDR